MAIWVGLVLGLVVGSFGNSLVHRLPRRMLEEWRSAAQEELGLATSPADESLHSSRSCCPRCHAVIRWFYNLPVVSWLLLRGRCRSCGAGISPRYLILECFGALIGAVAVAFWGLTLPALLIAAAAFLLLWAATIDIEHQLLPDTLVYPLFWLGLLAATQNWFVSAHDAVYGGLAGYAVLAIPAWLYRKLRGVDGLGDGDAKLLMALGTFLGPLGAVYSLLGACLCGLAAHAVLFVLKRADASSRLPFGQWIALGGVLAFLAQSLHWAL